MTLNESHTEANKSIERQQGRERYTSTGTYRRTWWNIKGKYFLFYWLVSGRYIVLEVGIWRRAAPTRVLASLWYCTCGAEIKRKKMIPSSWRHVFSSTGCHLFWSYKHWARLYLYYCVWCNLGKNFFSNQVEMHKRSINSILFYGGYRICPHCRVFFYC